MSTLKIPPVSALESEAEPTMPPFDPAQVPPCNMSQVYNQMATNPRFDPYHTDPINP
ncbi:MAG: hypothetical protein ACQCN5_10955 [Candidatus Bathyarchaeia archaeon]